MTYLLIYFFTFNNYKYFSFFSMFILGLITDSISGIPFGTPRCSALLEAGLSAEIV